MDTLSGRISKFGELAKVKVDERGGSPVWASAHDLRRAFGFRWSRKVNAMLLKELMRHSGVVTTETFYVGVQADETAAILELLAKASQTPETTKTSGRGDTSGDTSQPTTASDAIAL